MNRHTNANIEVQYLDLVKEILNEGFLKPNRTGVSAYTVLPHLLEHDCSLGFPILTTKGVPFRLIATELEGFIKGITDKRWFEERNCMIWSDWANPQKVPYGNDEETKQKMREEPDLGCIYGYEWRNFNSEGFDQLKMVVDTLKKDPYNRRMLCSAWNPCQMNQMALPACHVLWQVTYLENKLNLIWYQRSCDLMLGVPFNIASYGLLLHLLAKECGYEVGFLSGVLSDVHIYETHVDGANIQIQRQPHPCPTLKISDDFTDIFNWTADQCSLENYEHDEKIEFPIAV